MIDEDEFAIPWEVKAIAGIVVAAFLGGLATLLWF